MPTPVITAEYFHQQRFHCVYCHRPIIKGQAIRQADPAQFKSGCGHLKATGWCHVACNAWAVENDAGWCELERRYQAGESPI